MILRSPQFLLLLLALPLLVLVGRRKRGRVPALATALRLLGVTLIVLALADPVTKRGAAPPAGPLVVLVDQSESLGEEGRQALRERAETLAREHSGAVAQISFGARPQASADDELEPEAARQTDIAAALRLARGLAGAGSRVVLLSDGGQTRGDALGQAQLLGAAGVPVDTVLYEPPVEPEVWVSRVQIPRVLREGEEYTTSIVVHSTQAGEAQLVLLEGGETVELEPVALTAGENVLTYPGRAGEPGVLQVEARVESRADTRLENNGSGATALIFPPPRVLLVEGHTGGAAQLQQALAPAGIVPEVTPASRLPAQISGLIAYDGIVLLDVSASALSLDQMAALREFVRSEGRGLVATGGRTSFTLGAYKDTPLEELLPVAMTPPPRPERPPVAMLLIVDKSASMTSAEAPSKFDMAKESAILTTESLREEDSIGVLTFDTATEWVVDFQTIGSGLGLGEIQERISGIDPGGGTDIYRALDDGLPAIASQPEQVRHVILLTDGRSYASGRTSYEDLVNQARAMNITLSTIAIGEDSDTALLQDLASWGGGRYYFADQPEDIPRLTLLESEIAQAEPQVEGDFRAALEAPHPLLRDVTPAELPNLHGYVATTMKPEGELVLRSPEDDPLLAVWQYGLGRAVAWTPSVDEPWARPWVGWPSFGSFWAQLIRYTLPEPDSRQLQVRVVPAGASALISADARTAGGEPLDLADVEAAITLPDGSQRQLRLAQSSPGRYSQEVALPVSGPYALEVLLRKGDQTLITSAGYVHPYSAEYLPPRGGAELLAQISAASGGTPLQGGSASPVVAAPPAGAPTLWPWLLLGAAVLWPLEIAARRGWIGLGGRS